MAQSRIIDIHGNPLAFEPEPQTENDSKLIVQTVHDVLEEQEPRHVR